MEYLTDPINLISFILLSISMQIYMGIFCEKRKWKFLFVNPIMAIIVYVGLSVLPDIGTWGNAVLVTSFFSIYGMCIYQERIKKILFGIVLWESVGSLCDFIVLFMFSLSYTEEVIMSAQYYNFARLIAQSVFIFFTLFISRIISKRKYQKGKSQTSHVLLLMALATMAVDWGVYRIYLHSDSRTDYYAVLIAAIMMFMSVAIIKAYENLGERAELKAQNMVYQSQAEVYRVQISEGEETIKEVRRLKHDMKNHLIYIDELIRQKKDEEAGRYLKELMQSNGLSCQEAVNRRKNEKFN